MKDKIGNIEACVFDAYGTLFDVMAAAAHCKDELGEKWQPTSLEFVSTSLVDRHFQSLGEMELGED